MIIRNYDSGYVVVRHLHSSSLKEIYICRKAQEKSGREYTIIRIKDIAMCQRLIGFFTREIDEEKFSDFVECFTFEGKLNFVFAYSRGVRLMEKLTSDICPFAERLELAHKLMERIIYLDMPLSFLADALELDHITVNKGLEIRFNYELSYLNRLEDYSIQEAGLKLDDVMRRIFSEELNKMSCPEIGEFLEWLENGDYKTCLDIFYRFNRVYAVLKTKQPSELAVPKTRPFRAWDKLRRGLGWLKRLLMAALLIGALIYLVFSIADYITPDGAGGEAVERFDYIGTVEIQDNLEGEQQTEGTGNEIR